MKLKSLFLAIFVIFSIIGDAQEVLNQTDDQGKKQGTWVKKFENGQERYRGEFKEDKPVGTFFYYYDDGAKSSEVSYIGEDGTTSTAKFFHRNGTIMGEGKYLNQQKDGEWKYYDDQSMLSSIDNYENGKLNGMNKVFFLNGNVAVEIPFVDGLKNGDFVEFFSDGTIKMKGTYQDNTYTGKYFQNYADGKLMVEGEYKAAVKDGLWKCR
jgi:antitoxin component YwqK of YwqJK toxin-antitoxin module